MINPLRQGLFYEPSQLLSMVGFPDYGYYKKVIDDNYHQDRFNDSQSKYYIKAHRNPSFENSKAKRKASLNTLDVIA